MDPIGAALLYGTAENVEHYSKDASVADSVDHIVRDARIKVMKGATVRSVLSYVARNYPEATATKVAAQFTPCDHLLGIMWVDHKLFKNSAELKETIKARPTVRMILMDSLPNGRYWKQASVHREIPKQLFDRYVVQDKAAIKKAFVSEGFVSSLVDQGILVRSAAEAFTHALSKTSADSTDEKPRISLTKIARVLEEEIKSKRMASYEDSGSKLAADMEKSGLDIDLSQDMDMKLASVGDEVFMTLGDPDIDMDMVGASNDKLAGKKEEKTE